MSWAVDGIETRRCVACLSIGSMWTVQHPHLRDKGFSGKSISNFTKTGPSHRMAMATADFLRLKSTEQRTWCPGKVEPQTQLSGAKETASRFENSTGCITKALSLSVPATA